MGDSRGRWEGPTLVVDTIGFTNKNRVPRLERAAALIERFTRVDAATIDSNPLHRRGSVDLDAAVHRDVPAEENRRTDL